MFVMKSVHSFNYLNICINDNTKHEATVVYRCRKSIEKQIQLQTKTVRNFKRKAKKQ